ncbi:MAG: hypothetical protein J6S63_08225 [Atopobiaceae bacterium]|nr:hypothetical protein [Atopobiaceae bacterium]
MALDWKKEISLGDVVSFLKKDKKPGGGGSSAYPTKTTMNLYQGDTQTTNVRKLVVTGIVLALAIVVFVKFGVLDQLARVSQKEGELAAQKQLAMTMTQAYGDFDEVKELYDAYEARLGSNALDIIAILDMVEQNVKTKADVTAIVVADGTLTLTLYNVPLDTVGDLAKQLEGQELVQAANVTTVTTQNAEGQNTVSTLVVTLVSAEGGEE